MISRFYSSVGAFFKALHRPETVAAGFEALQHARDATVNEIKAIGSAVKSDRAASYNIDSALIGAVQQQSEKLSEGQRKALNRIRVAINSRASSRILLNGDVGSGKTLVFLLAAAAVARTTGGCVAVLVPSELVAMQMHRNACARFSDLNPSLVSGSSTSSFEGSSLLIGTQALLHAELPTLDLLVVDEQHKLAVDQREKLVGPATHVIEASATPIPRSLALALFEGWTEARIVGNPVDKKINCHLLEHDDKGHASRIASYHLKQGKKVIFVYPLLRGKTGDSRSLMDAATRLEEKFPGKVVALHGKLKARQKEEALAMFARGEKPVAVATTAVEVGVDVPDVAGMVVIGAERFGAAQLHQLRGRLVRNGGIGDFVMIPSVQLKKDAYQRLSSVRDTTDGFELAEKDMLQRGFGSLLGEMQSGATESLFKLARLGPEDFFATR